MRKDGAGREGRQKESLRSPRSPPSSSPTSSSSPNHLRLGGAEGATVKAPKARAPAPEPKRKATARASFKGQKRDTRAGSVSASSPRVSFVFLVFPSPRLEVRGRGLCPVWKIHPPKQPYAKSHHTAQIGNRMIRSRILCTVFPAASGS